MTALLVGWLIWLFGQVSRLEPTHPQGPQAAALLPHGSDNEILHVCEWRRRGISHPQFNSATA